MLLIIRYIKTFYTLCNWPIKVMAPDDPSLDNPHNLKSYCLVQNACYRYYYETMQDRGLILLPMSFTHLEFL